jgi:Flp pilus assembly pilin Flp
MDPQVQFGPSGRDIQKHGTNLSWTSKSKTMSISKRIASVTPLDSLVRLWNEESAQGLVEYVLILALIAFSAVAGISNLAGALNSAFSQVGTYLGKYIS